MIRFFLMVFRILLFGNGPAFPSLLTRHAETLLRDGLPRMVAVLGDPGTGKNFYVNHHIIEYKKKYPDEPMFILVWNGAMKETFIEAVLSDDKRDWLLEQIELDEIGHPKWVKPLPLFHEAYDPELPWVNRINLQVARVTQDFEKLNYQLVEQNPTLGGIPIKFMLPNFLKLVNAIPAGNGGSWQITEVRKFLKPKPPATKKKDKEAQATKKKGEEAQLEEPNELMIALGKFGKFIPRLKEYFFDEYFRTPFREQELRTNALRSILSVIEADEIRAKVGGEHPAWTPADAIEKGKIVIIDCSRLIGREAEQNFVFRYIFSLILWEIKKRSTLAPGRMVHLILDDATGFFNNEAISAELAAIPANYRAKRLVLYLIFQSLGQLRSGNKGLPGLKETFFTIGNIVTFALSDFTDAYTMAEQLFSFDPTSVKVPARTETQHDIMTNRDEQKAIRAAQIQRMAPRECLIRRYLTEQRRDPLVRHIARTANLRITVTPEEVAAAIEKLVQQNAVEVKGELASIRRRKLTNGPVPPQEPIEPSSV